MGKVLGNYVHYNWDNYLKAGTYRVEVWSNTQTHNDYDASIFKNYARVIQQHTNHLTQNIQNQELKKLENEINTKRSNAYNIISKKEKLQQALFVKVIENANLGDDINVDVMASMLKLDPKTEGIKLDKSIKKGKAIAKITIPKSGNYIQKQTIDRRFDIALSRIKTVDGNLQKILLEEYDKQLKSFQDFVKEHNEAVIALRKTGEKFTNRTAENTINAIPRNSAEKFIADIDEVTAVAALTANLNKIKGSFAEVMAVLGKYKAEDIAVETIMDQLDSFLKGLDKTAISSKEDIIDMKLNPSLWRLQDRWQKEQKLAQQFRTLERDKDNWFSFKVDHKSQQKVDGILEYGGKTLYANIKAYDMSHPTGPQLHHRAITLQSGTSLFMYLRMIQSQQMMPNIGNHFLNVFSHSSGDNYSNLRADANRALTIGLLYDALTGSALRQKDISANILVIEDTSKKLKEEYPRVRLYNIQDLIRQACNSFSLTQINSNIEIEPDISSISLPNNYIGEETSDKKTKAQNISLRITEILTSAKYDYQHFTIGLRKEFLNNFYKQYYKF